jgi:PTS system mannose-specific IID component
MIGPGTHLPKSVKLRVFLRSLLLQASWNPKGMQNLGLVYALYPALERLYPDPEKRREAVQRHLTFFNTHPYVAAAIVGGVLYHEERIAAGEEDPRRVTEFKGALMGPLAALGDGFFWLSLRPAAGALCAALVPWLGAWAAVLFLVLYNVVHFTLRARLFRMGLQLGDRLVEAVARARLPTRGARLRAGAAASAGAAAAYLAFTFGAQQGGVGGWLLAGGCLALGALSYLLVARKVPTALLTAMAALLAGCLGAWL